MISRVGTEDFRPDAFIGECPVILNILNIVDKVANEDATILITGESGTGKELIARKVHQKSGRKSEPLVSVNCGAIPFELLESELFGHEKGAFTGAHRERIGRFELADNGTIFLDEIGDVNPEIQVKLLRVLQEHSFERIGSTKTISVNIRIIAATNKNLDNSISDGKFREDLFYRLSVIPITLPPLRDRKSDIPLLVNHFLKKLQTVRKQKEKTFSTEAMDVLMHYHWPGNIRELENLIERLSVLVDHHVFEVSDLPETLFQNKQEGFPQPVTPVQQDMGFNDAVEQYQQHLILQALKNTAGVKSKAAELLKMNRTTLVEKMKKMNLKQLF
ncbi:MAG: sigma-54-dependent Fis family transcriptional regulator [Desulfobacteraceae bacterium]|nr:MAG: sigma-54-dependent Fis family transcriptional regulator [Desulfobacteraceae bacterium]